MSGIRSEFKFSQDDPRGDGLWFHLYLHFVDRTVTPPARDKRHVTWNISGTEFALAGDRAALIARRRAEEEVQLEQAVLLEMSESRTQLVRRPNGLERVSLAA